MRTSLDDDEAQEEDDWNIFEDDVNEELLPPTAEEERQAEKEAKDGYDGKDDNARTENPPEEPVKERRAVRVGGIHREEAETGEQTRKQINIARNEARNKSSGRGQRSERWEKLRAKVRRKDGERPRIATKNEAGRSALSRAFSEAKMRRDKGSQESKVKTKYSSGIRER